MVEGVGVLIPHLLVKEAVQDEDEHSLHAVEHSEDVGHDNCFLLEVQHAKYPSTSQEAELSDSSEGKDPDFLQLAHIRIDT